MMLLDLIRKCERFIKRHNWGGECPSAHSEHGGVILWKLTDSPNFFWSRARAGQTSFQRAAPQNNTRTTMSYFMYL